MLRRHLLILVVAFAIVSAASDRVHACSCLTPGPACQDVWTADAVFAGQVVSIGTADTSDSADRKRVRFSVLESFKLADSDFIDIHTGQGGGDCGYNFVEGRSYLVYAHRRPHTNELVATICSRTAPLEHAVSDLDYLRGPFRRPADIGIIRGVVTRTDPATPGSAPVREPLPSAIVRLSGYSQTREVESDARGAYTFAVPSGDYDLSFHVRPGLYASPGSDGVDVTLPDARACVVRDAIVQSDGRIRGRVLDANARPVPFMSIERIEGDHTLTNANGEFEFEKVPPGEFELGLDQAIRLGRGAVAPEEIVELGDLRLPANVSDAPLHGVVVDTSGRPVAGAEVRLRSGDGLGTLSAAAITSGDGSFHLSVVTGRTYELVAQVRPQPGAGLAYPSGRTEPFRATAGVRPFRIVLRPR